MTFHRTIVATIALLALAYQVTNGQAQRSGAAAAPADTQIERGRYLVEIGGCNDCHTAGYAEAGGKAADADRLTGDRLGYRGPWGTTYPTNLRLSVGRMTEDGWVRYARSLMTRPPMPWFSVRAMTEADQRAVYRYIRSLGPGGTAAPAFLPPDKTPTGPYILWPGVQ